MHPRLPKAPHTAQILKHHAHKGRAARLSCTLFYYMQQTQGSLPAWIPRLTGPVAFDALPRSTLLGQAPYRRAHPRVVCIPVLAKFSACFELPSKLVRPSTPAQKIPQSDRESQLILRSCLQIHTMFNGQALPQAAHPLCSKSIQPSSHMPKHMHAYSVKVPSCPRIRFHTLRFHHT